MSEKTLKNLKLILIVALVFGLIGAVLFLVYGFSIIWQGFAAGIIIGFLSLVSILLVILTIYLWLRTVMLQHEVKKTRRDLKNVYKELKATNESLRQKEEIE